MDKHATGFIIQASIHGKEVFGKEYSLSINHNDKLDKKEGSVGLGDEPGKWLCNTGASNHFSPFKHLFIDLKKYEPVPILTGNG